MEKDQFKQILKTVTPSKGITPLIHNYCDRWCERCTHTNQCSVFRIEKELTSSNEVLDFQNKQFWTSLNDMFKATVELMQEKMHELDLKPEIKVPADDFITKSISNEMVVISRNYTMSAAKWLDRHHEIILEKYKLLQNISNENAFLFADAVEVIQHYYILIATKTYRAALVFDDSGDEPDDSRGSAKVTIIVIDRSIAAWTSLLKQLPAMEDDILQFLKTLSQIKRSLLITFPTAMEFKRPGFDD